MKPRHRRFVSDDDVADGGQAGAAAERRAVNAARPAAAAADRSRQTSATSPSRRAGSRLRCSRIVFDIHATSAPAQNVLPAPASTTTRSRRRARRAHERPPPTRSARAMTCSLNALRTSGRLRTRCSTGPSTLVEVLVGHHQAQPRGHGHKLDLHRDSSCTLRSCSCTCPPWWCLYIRNTPNLGSGSAR